MNSSAERIGWLRMPLRRISLCLCLLSVEAAVACDSVGRPTPSTPVPRPTPTPKAPLSEHQPAPHGGTLVHLGDEFAHLEFVFYPRFGRVTAYVWDGALETPARLRAEPMDMYVAAAGPSGVGPPLSQGGLRLWLSPLDETTDGLGVSWATTFAGEAADLRGLTAFDAMLPFVVVKGTAFRGLTFRVMAVDPSAERAPRHESLTRLAGSNP